MSAAFKLAGQRVLVSAELNGRLGFSFALDTGAALSGLRNQVAKSLALPVTGTVKLNEGQAFPVYSVNSLVLGDTIRQSGLSLFGLPGDRLGADGLLAANMLTRFDSELDFDAMQWRIYPQGRLDRDRTGYRRLPAEFIGGKFEGAARRMFGVVKIDGRVIDVLLDTGSPWSLSLNTNTAQRLGLWRDDRAYAPVSQFTINGQQTPARLVRAAGLDVAGTSYSRPLVVLRAPDAPPAANVLGLGILRTLNLLIDRQTERLWTKRNALVPHEHRYPTSGLLLEAGPSGVRVTSVGYASPAFRAGINAGDLVVGPSSRDEVNALLSGARGPEVVLQIQRDQRVRPVALTLEQYL